MTTSITSETVKETKQVSAVPVEGDGPGPVHAEPEPIPDPELSVRRLLFITSANEKESARVKNLLSRYPMYEAEVVTPSAYVSERYDLILFDNVGLNVHTLFAAEALVEWVHQVQMRLTPDGEFRAIGRLRS
jgi:hypothetical protein